MSKNNIDIYDMMPSIQKLIEENENLKQENQELKEKNLKISIENNNSKIVEEMNKTVVENKNKQLLEATELNITYLDKIIMLKKTIEILKDSLGLYLVNKKFGERIVYALMSKTLGMCLLNPTQEQYKLLEEVFESVGDNNVED